jgi:flagellar protein FliS
MALSYAPNLGAYRTAAVHGGVASSDPHGLILMLMNGALERIAKARGCIANKAYAEKAQLIHRTVSIIDELRNSLNLQAGGELATNLDNLYEYMCRQLLKATVENNVAPLDEVTKLLSQVRDAWQQVPAQQGARK